MSTTPFSAGREFDAKHIRTQKDVIRDVMLSARDTEAWLTLDELKKLTKFGEASISAQLRHLKKDGYGLAKRVRSAEHWAPSACGHVEYEYQLEAK